MERRRTGRRVPASGEPISRVRLRTGRELLVVDVGDAGALVEGTARLLPGTHLEVHVVTADGRVLVRSRVARSAVSRLDADGVCYRSALAFDRIIDTRALGYAIPQAIGSTPPPEGSPYPDHLDAATSPRDEVLLAETVTRLARDTAPGLVDAS